MTTPATTAPTKEAFEKTIQRWIEEHEQATIQLHNQLIENPILLEPDVIHALLSYTVSGDIEEVSRFVNFAIMNTIAGIENGMFDEEATEEGC